MSIKETRTKGIRTLISISIIAIAVYFGFEPLINNVPDGIAQQVISSSFGAIFVIILTMYLLNKQTEIEQESKKSEKVFDEKVQLFKEIMTITRDMLLDGKISKEEINRLPFPLIRLQMLADDETIKSFSKVNQKLNKIYGEDEINETVAIPEEDKNEIFKLLSEFASQCRLDLGIADRDVEEELIIEAVETISETGKKGRDYSKVSFNGEEYPKNRYVWEVMNNFVKENPDLTLDGFEKILSVWKLRKTAGNWRSLILTSEAIYDATLGHRSCKRRCHLATVRAITACTASGQFLIHIDETYDALYVDRKKQAAVIDGIVQAAARFRTVEVCPSRRNRVRVRVRP